MVERCGARLPKSPAKSARAAAHSEAALAAYLRRTRCRLHPVPGCTRCRFHGGLSTGPRTEAGKARTIAAMVAGRDRWIARMRAQGEPIGCGRHRSGRNSSLEEREQAAFEKRRKREARAVRRQIRAEREAHRRSPIAVSD